MAIDSIDSAIEQNKKTAGRAGSRLSSRSKGLSTVSKKNETAPRAVSKTSKRAEFVRPENPWEMADVKIFKMRNIEPHAIIDNLRQLTKKQLPFMGDLPPPEQLVSTDPLDSLMTAIYQVIKDRSLDFTDEVRENIHLATGTRTDFCETILMFICHHQKLEVALRDSVDFFMESLNTLVRLESDNLSMKSQIGTLLELKEGGILEKYGPQKGLELERKRVEDIAERERQAKETIVSL